MLTIRTTVRPSAIHGNGVFAEQRVLPGETVWQFAPMFDRVIANEDLVDAPQAFLEFLEMYAYRSTDMNGDLILSCDNARYLNHSPKPNTEELPFRSIAREVISIGDEITCDYGTFCSDGLGFEFANDPSIAVRRMMLPHENLYTRIKAGAVGVGVFAIRDIPGGVNPFEGDVGAVVSVPVADVDRLSDEELRRMYYDFCPVAADGFVAPRDFNQLTVGWYVNHSSTPNLTAISEMKFITNRVIRLGEEITSDYSTYSAHARRFINDWAAGIAGTES